MTHRHEPWAEQDADGMWEPACRWCGILSGYPFEVVVARCNTEEEALASASAIIAMLGQEDGS